MKETQTHSNLATTDHGICVVCGDRATGKHYGVISCEGCKGFFKRAVRKHQSIKCRMSKKCFLDQKRTKCPACRYRVCIDMGMRITAVQQERPRNVEGGSHCHPNTTVLSVATSTLTQQETVATTTDVPSNSSCSSESNHSSRKPSGSSESTSSPDEEADHSERVLSQDSSSSSHAQLTLGILLGGELLSDAKIRTNESGVTLYVEVEDRNVLEQICQALEKQMHLLMKWAKYLFHFSGLLPREDHGCMFRAAWPELVMITTSYNSTAAPDGLLLSTGRYLSRSRARNHGLGPLVDRILNEIVSRFREIHLGRVELVLLRAIVLFNPDAPNLTNRAAVEAIREKLYTGLHAYCMARHGAEASRFTKLMLRLPTVRAIAHKCLEHLVFVKIAAADPSCRQLSNFLERGIWPINTNSP